MLEIQKKVLKGVSNDLDMFKKELIKSHAWLSSSELDKLKEWLLIEFNDDYVKVINDVMHSEMV